MQRSSDDPGAGNVLVGLLIEPLTTPRVGATIWPVFHDAFFSDLHGCLTAAGLTMEDADAAVVTLQGMVNNPGDLP